VPLCVLLLLAGVLLLWRAKNRRWGRALASAGLGVLLLGALPPLPEAGIRYLEAPWSIYKPAAGADVRWVVVLGGGVTVDPGLPPTAQLTRSSLIRLVEGIRILGLHPQARLLLSGGTPFGAPRSEAAVMADAARQLGVSADRIVLEESSWDTEGQAAGVRPIVGRDPFVVVTTASHLRRAMALFEAQGLSPIPAPAEPRIKQGTCAIPDLRWLYPSAENLQVSTVVVYEFLGMAWARLRGKA
jgi:uncharacterized SAM-binding protein YcdF (DUF218 family)